MVEASGGGLLARLVSGKRVCVLGPITGDSIERAYATLGAVSGQPTALLFALAFVWPALQRLLS